MRTNKQQNGCLQIDNKMINVHEQLQLGAVPILRLYEKVSCFWDLVPSHNLAKYVHYYVGNNVISNHY